MRFLPFRLVVTLLALWPCAGAAQETTRFAIEATLSPAGGGDGTPLGGSLGVGLRLSRPLGRWAGVWAGVDRQLSGDDVVCVAVPGESCESDRRVGGVAHLAVEARSGDIDPNVVAFAGAGTYAAWWLRAEGDDGRLTGAPIGPLATVGLLVHGGRTRGFLLRAEGMWMFNLVGRTRWVPRLGFGWRF